MHIHGDRHHKRRREQQTLLAAIENPPRQREGRRGDCLPTEPGVIFGATPSLQDSNLIYSSGLLRARGRDSPLPHPRHPLEGSDIIPVLRRLYVNCGKEDWERERAMLSETQRERKQGKPSSSTNLCLLAAEKPAGPGALPWRFGPVREAPRPQRLASDNAAGAGLGKAPGRPSLPLACTARPGGGELDGTQKGHREGTTLVTERRDCSRGAASPGPFQPLIPCDMLWGMTGCGGRGELAVCRERLREKSKGEKCYSETTFQLTLGDLA